MNSTKRIREQERAALITLGNFAEMYVSKMSGNDLWYPSITKALEIARRVENNGNKGRKVIRRR